MRLSLRQASCVPCFFNSTGRRLTPSQLSLKSKTPQAQTTDYLLDPTVEHKILCCLADSATGRFSAGVAQLDSRILQ